MGAVCKPSLERHLKPVFIPRSENRANNGGMYLSQRLPAAGLAVLLCAALGWAAPARASDDDHEQAQRAVQAGEVMPLHSVLARLAREYPGQVLDVELEREDGRWVYEIKLLQPGGQRVKLKLDARSAELIERRDRRERHPQR